ncbi:CDP-alcohol phosphatidyltransferase family protein [Motilimonas eburnea]|uniref:CDP-alcohol phosphatidyltransferase family protein n=1 Tax=Motilimonas eburnea TaxID=1737488 RepID=UPI001E2E357B|nr:CDP-alcohol phosphatidyltransferase family protein [Motilimonas eburnea]MCE2570884.1 CDP-alcohol phosphatidyltransferase family protein [Motilimonas eburnea]
MSIYLLKSRFQTCLRPLVAWLYQHKVTANQVTLLAMIISALLGAFLCLASVSQAWFLLVPVWMFLRMAFNAIDGMLAREFGQQSPLGAYLNELSDVLADAALLLPFVFIPLVDPVWVLAIIFFATLTEMAGVLGLMVGASRRYDGPMGKSDRAFVFGLLALLWGLDVISEPWFNAILIFTLLLLLPTLVNRVRGGLAELK